MQRIGRCGNDIRVAQLAGALRTAEGELVVRAVAISAITVQLIWRQIRNIGVAQQTAALQAGKGEAMVAKVAVLAVGVHLVSCLPGYIAMADCAAIGWCSRLEYVRRVAVRAVCVPFRHFVPRQVIRWLGVAELATARSAHELKPPGFQLTGIVAVGACQVHFRRVRPEGRQRTPVVVAAQAVAAGWRTGHGMGVVASAALLGVELSAVLEDFIARCMAAGAVLLVGCVPAMFTVAVGAALVLIGSILGVQHRALALVARGTSAATVEAEIAQTVAILAVKVLCGLVGVADVT
jgi:hypothetical protein